MSNAVRVASLLVRAARSSDDSSLWGERHYSIAAKHLDALLARLAAAEQERDELLARMNGLVDAKLAEANCRAAEARAEAAEPVIEAARQLARGGDRGFGDRLAVLNSKLTAWDAFIARAALAGREERQ